MLWPFEQNWGQPGFKGRPVKTSKHMPKVAATLAITPRSSAQFPFGSLTILPHLLPFSSTSKHRPSLCQQPELSTLLKELFVRAKP